MRTRKIKRSIEKLHKPPMYVLVFDSIKKLWGKKSIILFLPFKKKQKLFGFISLTLFDLFFHKTAYFDDFIVHKKLRGKGHAKQLFKKAEKKAITEQCDSIVLVSGKKRKASHKFYKKMGMKIIPLGVLGIVARKKINKDHEKK